MKKILIIFTFLSSFLFAQINIGETIIPFTLSDQFDKIHTISNDTKKLIFVFEKASGHLVKEFLDTKSIEYLNDKKALFIVDASGIPSFIKWLVFSHFKNHKYSIVILEEEDLALKYVPIDDNMDKIMVVYLTKQKVTDVRYFLEVKNFIESL